MARISGWAYREPASLEVDGDTLRWRAQVSALRGETTPENVVTTVHDVRYVRYVELRWSRAALAIAALGVIWMIRESVVVGCVLVGVALAISAWRLRSPRRFLALEMRDRRLVLRVDDASAQLARTLAERIDQAIATGEVAATPPALP